MSQPRGHQMNVEREFPKTRKDAQRVAAVIREQCRIAGCTCQEIQVDFIDPPLMAPYVQVGHHIFCPLSSER